MKGEFTGKIAFITGSSGIGLGAALKIAKEGGEVYLCGIDKNYNEKAIDAGKGLKFFVSEVDISEETAVAKWINDAASNAGGIDILINAAGIQTFGNIESTSSELWDRTMNINLRSYFLTSHYAYRHMKPRGKGSIIHVSSVQGHMNQYDVLAYATSKGALHAMTRAMAVDCAKDNIRVNSLSPGSIRTPLLEFSARSLASENKSMEDMIKEFGKGHPMGRVGKIEETSEMIAFLASERSGFCTGGDYLVDGGLSAHVGI